MIRDWAMKNLSPQAKIRDTAIEIGESLQRLPGVIRQTERVLADFQEGGLMLHPSTVESMMGRPRNPNRWVSFAWAAIVLLGALLAVEFLGVTVGG